MTVILTTEETYVANRIWTETGINTVHFEGTDDDLVFLYSYGRRSLGLFIDEDDEGYVVDSATMSATEYVSKEDAIQGFIFLLQAANVNRSKP